jgi:hypothetical protein
MMQHPIHSHTKGQRLTERSRTSYYVLASSNGKQMLWGAYGSRSEAEKIGMSRANGVYEVIELPTSDTGAATQMLRERGILEQGFNSDSFRRFKHI